jgi:hypothetical protein
VQIGRSAMRAQGVPDVVDGGDQAVERAPTAKTRRDLARHSRPEQLGRSRVDARPREHSRLSIGFGHVEQHARAGAGAVEAELTEELASPRERIAPRAPALHVESYLSRAPPLGLGNRIDEPQALGRCQTHRGGGYRKARTLSPMIARLRYTALFAVVASSAVFATSAWADDPPADAPAPAAEGAPMRPQVLAPPVEQAPATPPMPPTPPMLPPTVRRVDASEPRKITGMVLSFIGAFHGFAGTVVFGTFAGLDAGSGFGFALGLVIGGPLMGEGLILSSIGIPLWVTGARTVEKVDSAFVPSVDLGPGAATATWRF